MIKDHGTTEPCAKGGCPRERLVQEEEEEEELLMEGAAESGEVAEGSCRWEEG